MSQNKHTIAFMVAGHVFTVDDPCGLKAWQEVAWHYEPFATAPDAEPLFSVALAKGLPSLPDGLAEIYLEQPSEVDMGLSVHSAPDGALLFTMQQPATSAPNAWLLISPDGSQATLWVDEENASIIPWKHEASLTSGLMLAYLMATTGKRTLLSHAACVVRDGNAFFFIGKSGTGKSTHARQWLKHIPGSHLLNDDHPIVRILDDGTVMAYGSPWSGKTNCYINRQAPLAAVVRIKQHPENFIERQSPLQAYASLSSSFSGLKWIPSQADSRHLSLEDVVRRVPCFLLSCRPDAEAARVCCAEVDPNCPCK